MVKRLFPTVNREVLVDAIFPQIIRLLSPTLTLIIKVKVCRLVGSLRAESIPQPLLELARLSSSLMLMLLLLLLPRQGGTPWQIYED